MSVYLSILELLNKNEIDFKELVHKEVFTSEEAAKVRGTSIDIGAKALVLIGDKKPMLLVVPANSRANLKKAKTHLGIKNLSMASREEVYGLTSLEPGCIPPFGSIMQLETFFDNSFLIKEKVAFNPGLHNKSVIMNANDLLRLEKPTLLDLI